MSKSHFAALLAVGFLWLAVSCAGPIAPKPVSRSTGESTVASARPAGAAVSASGAKSALSPSSPQVATPASLIGPSATIAAVSRWKDSGIFFYPLLAMALIFGIALYKSSGKTA